MGMTIDEMYDWLYRLKSEILVFMPKEWHEPMRDSIQDAITFSRKYQMMQADYEIRLRADMAAMLTDLKNKLIDKSWNIDMYDDDLDFECCYLNDIDEVIQQKINALKGDSDGT